MSERCITCIVDLFLINAEYKTFQLIRLTITQATLGNARLTFYVFSCVRNRIETVKLQQISKRNDGNFTLLLCCLSIMKIKNNIDTIFKYQFAIKTV